MKIARCPACGRREKRSTQANARMWLLLHLIAGKVEVEQLNELGEGLGTYRKCSPMTWHIYFKKIWIGCDDITLPDGQVIAMPHSSTELDVSEFSDYMTKIEAWAAERDVYLDEIENAA